MEKITTSIDALRNADEFDWDGGPEINGKPVRYITEIGTAVYVFTDTATYRAKRKVATPPAQ